MTTESIRNMTRFKRTKKGVRLVDDRNSMVAEWRDGCPDQPTNHDAACVAAITLMHERGVIA